MHTTLPRKTDSPHLILERAGDETLVYDRQRDTVFVLDPDCTVLYDHCDGKTSQSAACARIGPKKLRAGLETLEKLGLVEAGQPPGRAGAGGSGQPGQVWRVSLVQSVRRPVPRL